nr:MAG TPA: hypothetical protein [Caudoviricetes sp.]
MSSTDALKITRLDCELAPELFSSIIIIAPFSDTVHSIFRFFRKKRCF